MRFSIITATFNAERHIERNVRSVMAQQCDVQHLIVDNCSTDRTLEIVRDCRSPHVEIVSEKDRGIYDAFNKGVARARGDVLAVLNADDFYLDGTLHAVQAVFERDPGIACVHGNIQVERNGNVRVLRPRSGITSFGGVRVFHPAFFCRRAVFERVGQFDTSYLIAADFDFFIRARREFTFHHLDQPLTHFSLGGISTHRRFLVSNEVYAIARKHRLGLLCSTFVWSLETAIKVAATLRNVVRN